MEVTVFGLTYGNQPALHLSLEQQDPHSTLTIGPPGPIIKYRADTSHSWAVAVPDGSALERNEIGLMSLAWDFRGSRVRASANEVFSFADLGLHGFRFNRQPD